MQKLKMCTNLFLWSICLFLIIFLYYCPGRTIGHDNHRFEPNGSERGYGGPTDLHRLDDPAFIASEDKCPCISRDQCPRIYGETATDVKELGFLKPCKEFGTVRCCGVTVSIRIETEKEGDRDDVFDKLKRSSTKTVEELGSEKNATTKAFGSSGTSKLDAVGDEGGIHSNYLWDRDDDLDVAESNLSNIESGSSSANDEDSKASPAVTSLPPPSRPEMKLRPRKKLMQRAQVAPGAANIKDKINDLNLRAASNENDQSRVNKELNLEEIKAETQSVPDGGNVGKEREDSAPSSVVGTQEMSKISKLRIVRPGGPKMRRLNQQQHASENRESDSETQDQEKALSQISMASTSGQEAGTSGLPPRMKKRIVRRKKVNTFSPTSSEADTLPAQPETTVNRVNSGLDGPIPSFSLPPRSQPELSQHLPEPDEPGPILGPVTPAQQHSNANKFLSKHGPHSVLIRRKPITPSRPAPDTEDGKPELASSGKNSFNTGSGEEEVRLTPQQFKPAGPFKFPRFQSNATADAAESAPDLAEEKAEHEGETLAKETSPASRPSPVGITKPMRKRLRPIRPASEKTSDDTAPKLSIMTPATSGASKTSTSYTSTSSSSSSYPNPIRKLQKLRKRMRPVIAPKSKPATEVTSYSGEPEASNPEIEGDGKEEAIRIEAPTTPKYKFSSSISYTASRRKEAKIPPMTRAPVAQHVAQESPDNVSAHHGPFSPMSVSTRVNAGEGHDAETDADTDSHSGTPSITGASKESDMELTSTAAGKIENIFASTSSSSLLSPVAISTPQHSTSAAEEIPTVPRPAQPSTHVSHQHNRLSVKLRTHSKNDDEGEAGGHEAGEKVLPPHGTRQMGRHSQEHERQSRPTAEYETTPLVTSTYSKIRVGNTRHKNRLTINEDEEEQVEPHFQNNNLMTPAPKEAGHFVSVTGGGASKKGGSRRFSVSSAFDIVGSNEFQATPRPVTTHQRYLAEEDEDSYDVVLDKDVRHNLKKTTHNRLADVSQEETRTLEFVNRHPATTTVAITLPPITEPKRTRIRRPTPSGTSTIIGTNDQSTNYGTKKRLHSKVEFGNVVEEMQVHPDLVPPEKHSNYEPIKSTTAFPPYKPRSTATTASPITSAYSGSSNSQSKRRRVEKPSLLLQSERNGPDTEEHVQNINSGSDASRIGSQYNHQYSHEYEQPQTYAATTTTPAPYVHHHRNTKTEVEQLHTKGISNYYFNEVSTTPTYYVHTSTLPSFAKAGTAEGEQQQRPESGSKFVFPPYRFEITSKSATAKNETQKSKHAGPEIIYSATLPTTTPQPRTEAAYYHHITPTESPYGGAQYPSTTPMPAFVYYTSTGIPKKEDDGLYHRHHHLHYLANNDNLGPSTQAPADSTVAFSGGFMPIRPKNASSTRFQAPEVFDLPSNLNSNAVFSYEATSPSPVTPSPIVSYTGLHGYNNEAKPAPAPYDHVQTFPGHVEIGGTKRPVSVQVRVAGLNGQTHHPPQHVQPTAGGGSSKPHLQTVIDIQNPRESTPDYVQYHQSHHQETPHHSTRTEIVNNAVASSNPDGLTGGSGSSGAMHHKLYQYFGKDKEMGGLGTHHHQLNFGTGVQVNEASLKAHAPSVVQVQHHYGSNSYEHSPQQLFNQIPPQVQEELNALRSQMQTTINITNHLPNIQQQQYFGQVSSTPSPPLFTSAFENSFKQFNSDNAFQQQNNDAKLNEADSAPGKANSNQHTWNAFGTSHQSATPSFTSGANLLSQTSAMDGDDVRNNQPSSQMFRHNFNGMFPASPQQQQPLIQFIQHSRPLTDAPTTPSSVWKFPEPQPQVQQQQPQIVHQSQPPQLLIPDVQAGQYNHQKHTLQYQAQDYTGSGLPSAIRGGPLPPLAPPQVGSGLTGGGPPREMMNRPNPGSIIQFGSAVASDGHLKGHQMNGQQQQKRPTNNANLPAGLIRIPQQPPPRKNVPHYIKEYHQHHSISQEILSQLKNSNRFNPFSGNARTSRATNLDDIEIIKASQDVQATAAGNDETVSTQETLKDAENVAVVPVPASAAALSADEKKVIMNNVDFVVVHSKKEGTEEETSAADGKETAFTQPEVVSYFSLPETVRSLDSTALGDDEGESDAIQLAKNSGGEDGEESGDGSFSEPKTVQRGFLPILPYSETDPGPLLVNVKDFNGAASRTAKALENIPPPPPRVVVTLTDDAGSPRPGPQT